MLAVALVLFAQTAPGTAPPGRPSECSGLEARAANVWERAKAPALRHYCDLLASGASKLAANGGRIEDLLAIADDAERALPGRAAPSVLRGRALSRLGRHPEAYAALKDARAKDERAFDDPVSLLAWARESLGTGHDAEGIDAYRMLLPRASSLPSQDRGAAYLEAGVALMVHGPSSLDEAIAVLRQARREASDAAEALSVLALSLALDRAGERDEARATLDERLRGDPKSFVTEVRGRKLLDDVRLDKELDAIEGLVLERRDPAAARAAWQRYEANAPSGPWAQHARAHEAALAGHGAERKPR